MRRPTFYIVGAPKCGTTALYEFLGQHPDIFTAARKEMHFFGADLIWPDRPGREEYLAQFEAWKGEAVAGEASVYYLQSHSAAQEIREFNPDARIIIMLRNPVETIHSLYQQVVFNLQEDLPVFEQALAAEADRRRGAGLPPFATKPQQLYYRETVRYCDQVQRYLDRFGAQRVHIIVHDDLRREPRAVIAAALRFLGVDPGFVPELRVVNPGRQFRSRLLQKLIKHPPRWLVAATRGMRSSPVFLSAYRAIIDANSRPLRQPPMQPETRTMLAAEFAPEVERLGRMLGRDLSHWTQPIVTTNSS